MYDICVISDDVVGPKMAGPGIRVWELSRCLAEHFKVILAIPDYSSKGEDQQFVQSAAFDVVPYSVEDPAPLEQIGKQSKILLVQGYVLSKFPALKNLHAHLIVDLYVPFPLENLFVHQQKIKNILDREHVNQRDLKVFNDQIISGDHFLCASERQKDLFTGSLMSLNRITPKLLDASPDMTELITVVPFGIRDQKETSSSHSVLRNTVPGITDKDVLFLWGGVLTNWFDPLTLLYALSDALEVNPDLKLYFLSTQHPNPKVPEFDMARKALVTSKDLGLTDKSVFFHPGWVDYSRRHLYFMDADIGISIHKTHFETRFAFRTRMLDYIKFGLPIICTEGDYFAELVIRENLGIVVRSENRDDIKNALLSLAAHENQRREMAQNLEKIKSRFYWTNMAEPLVRYSRSVLEGKSLKTGGPDRTSLAFITSSQPDSPFRRKAKRYLGGILQKLPLKLAAKIKRFLKFIG